MSKDMYHVAWMIRLAMHLGLLTLRGGLQQSYACVQPST
jgi:hypothetical protein